MAFNTRALVLIAIATSFCLQFVAAYPNADKSKDDNTSQTTFSLTRTLRSMFGFQACQLALMDVISHFREIYSIALEYVTLTTHVATESLTCIVSNSSSGIMKCISGVMEDHRPSFDLLHESLKTMLKSLGRSLKDLSLCPFN